MNDLYGVDPGAPETSEELIALLRMFGPTEGRFILDFPNDWAIRAREMLDGQPEIQRMRALEWLQRRRSAVLNLDRRYNAQYSWSENAMGLRDVTQGLIGARECAAHLLPIDRALFGLDTIPDGRGAHVPRSAIAYKDAVWPLMSFSPKVALIDPYFRLTYWDQRQQTTLPSIRHRNVLLTLLKEAARLRRVEVFALHVSREQIGASGSDTARFEDELGRLSDESGAVNMTIEYSLLEEGSNAEQHARYILGTGCGLQFDHGFDTSKDGSTNHVHWLSPAEVTPLLVKFDLPEH